MNTLQRCVKCNEEIVLMRAACKVAARVLREASFFIQPGITTISIDNYVGESIRRNGGVSAFFGYHNFPRQCCVSVNEEVIHGLASKRILQFGDLVKIDVGVKVDGFIGDVAMTVPVGGCSLKVQKMLDTTAKSLHDGISQIRGGALIRDVSKAIQVTIESCGFSVVREFVGHGVGRSLHEEPQIPNYVEVSNSNRLLAGMTIAVEPMVNLGSSSVEILDDGWTVVTCDRQVSAHFEHTVLVTDSGCEILTLDGCSSPY